VNVPETLPVVLLTLRVSSTALLLALAIGVPLGAFLGTSRFRGRTAAIAAANAGMSLPPVIVGLGLSLLLWRSGPMGALGLMYTPTAMVIAQAIIGFPTVVGLTAAAVEQLGSAFQLQLRSLGASRVALIWLCIRESGLPVVAAGIAVFGRLLGEVGAVLMVGGNIHGQTRVLTTAIVLETGMGRFDSALALGAALLAMSLAVNIVIAAAARRRA
jgi:tungstate transport system permease protein